MFNSIQRCYYLFTGYCFQEIFDLYSQKSKQSVMIIQIRLRKDYFVLNVTVSIFVNRKRLHKKVGIESFIG